MLQQETPDDYVIATHTSHSVQEFVESAFEYAGLNWRDHIVIDPRLYRRAEVDLLIGNPAKARQVLGWEPGCTLPDLVREMVDQDCRAVGVAVPESAQANQRMRHKRQSVRP